MSNDTTTSRLKTMITPPSGTADVMIDLETLSTRPDAAIISIGACWFNADLQQVGHPWHTRIDMADSIRSGGHVDGDTVRWWLRQSDAARASITEGCSNDIDDALQGLAMYLHSVAPQKEVRVWGNGADFGLPILASAYARADREQPWRYFNGRCLRTLRKLLPQVEAPAFEGTEHNAAHDAQHQARHAIALLRAMQALSTTTAIRVQD